MTVNFVEPEVNVLAHTQLDVLGLGDELDPVTAEPHLYTSIDKTDMLADPYATDAETLIEYAGRLCYRSFHRPNEATNTAAKYISRTLFGQKHWSIAEHVTITVEIKNISRAITHELVRHRGFGFSQESQRFIDMSDFDIVLPAAYENDLDAQAEIQMALEDIADVYDHLVRTKMNEGLSRKQAREAARSILPNNVATSIVVTGSIREWIFMLDRRIRYDADADFQKVARLILKEIAPVAPAIFEKFEEELLKELGE